MAAQRTQIYLSKEQRLRIDRIAKRDRTTLAGVIRDAVDAYVAARDADPRVALDATFGAAPQLEVPSRDEWSRG